MGYEAINIIEKFGKFDSFWTPKIISEMNDYQFKLLKAKGEFVWHSHTETDETFIIIKGSLTILFRDGEVNLNEGEMYIVPKGTEHKPIAETECHILLVEPVGVINTGDAEYIHTAPLDSWL